MFMIGYEALRTALIPRGHDLGTGSFPLIDGHFRSETRYLARILAPKPRKVAYRASIVNTDFPLTLFTVIFNPQCLQNMSPICHLF